MTHNSITALVCAYNEDNIYTTIDYLKNLEIFEAIIVVDDGSSLKVSEIQWVRLTTHDWNGPYIRITFTTS